MILITGGLGLSGRNAHGLFSAIVWAETAAGPSR
jgi:hypothetical protein